MDNLSLMMYTEIDAICIFLLVYIAVKAFHNIERRQSWHYYRIALYNILLLVVFDMLWKWVECGLFSGSYGAAYLINSLYFLCSVAATILWFLYTEDEMNTGLVHNRTFKVFVCSPLLLMLVLLIVSYFNGCMFSFGENRIYQRGPLIGLSFFIPCAYLLLSIVRAAFFSLRKENYLYRKTCVSLACFSFITIFSCMMQILVPGTPIQCMGITGAVLLIYMTAQEQLVTIDPLTKLNNRHQMVRYLTAKLENPIPDTLYLMIVDLDRFKQINDTFGHVEGDRALVRLAKVLKKTSQTFHCFAARYGGDEFVLVHETSDEQEIGRLCEFLTEKLDESNHSAQAGYNLQVSIGCARHNEAIRYVPDFIAAADAALYEIKRSKKGLQRV